MSVKKDWLRSCEREVATLRKQLEPLESGRMHVGERHLGSDWVDTTQQHIELLKRGIATYEAILARHKT